MLDIETALLEFSPNDRCDRCGAQAYSLARRIGYSDLLFCLHHRKEHFDILFDSGWEIVDNYEAISRLADGHGYTGAAV